MTILEKAAVGGNEKPNESPGGQLIWPVYLCVGLILLTAFRAILITPFALPDPSEFEYWFFIPNRDSGAVSILIAGWLFWNRRERFQASRNESVKLAHWVASVAIAIGFLWANWVSAQALYIPILCMTLALLSVAWGGRSALTLLVMPCAALMLAFPPPSPLLAEILWRLQGITASGASAILTFAGYAPQLDGTELRLGEYAFIIIEACSGWRGIQILMLVAVAASELNEIRFRKTIWVVLAAIPLGIGLNVIRACLVVLTQEEIKAEFFESHNPQGIAVLLVGAVTLYVIAAAFSGEDIARREDASVRRDGESDLGRAPSAYSRWALFSLAVPLALLAISFSVPILRGPEIRIKDTGSQFPMEFAGWIGTPVPLDYFFPYSTAANPQFHAVFRDSESERSDKITDLFIGWETPKPSGLDRMPDAKLILPADDWTIVSRKRSRVLQLGIDSQVAVLEREGGTQFSYVVAWRIRDRGLIAESLLSLIGIRGCGEPSEPCRRVVVRVAVPILQNDENGYAQARDTIKGFIDSMVLPLKSLWLR